MSSEEAAAERYEMESTLTAELEGPSVDVQPNVGRKETNIETLETRYKEMKIK